MFNRHDSANAQQLLENTAHLCLEAENCDADADDRCDAHCQKHHFCVVVTKKKKAKVKFWETQNICLYADYVRVYLPGNSAGHVGQSQGLKNNSQIQNDQYSLFILAPNLSQKVPVDDIQK